MNIELKHLTYKEIGQRARVFLSQYHPDSEIPVPIEKIVDVKMGLDIYPFPRLYKEHGQNGFLTADRKVIYVDEYQYDHYYEKYCFTIAHEIGHFILHRNCYETLAYSSIEEYIKWRLSEDPDVIEWYEKQADWFAEQVLVPTGWLERVCRRVIEKHREQLSVLRTVPEDFWSYASNEIAEYFQVNPPVIEIRIRREGLAQKINVLE